MLTCEQFEIRVQDLMDQRLDLSADTLIREHADHCSSCRHQLDSFLSLEDSFSGKIPASYFQGVETAGPARRNRWSAWFPLVATLSLGILIGLTLANLDRFRSPANDMASVESPLDQPAGNTLGDATVDVPGGNVEGHVPANENGIPAETSGNSATGQSDYPKATGGRGRDLANANRVAIVSIEQFRSAYPTLDLYYRLSDEIPGIRTIKDSFRVAWEWVEQGLPFRPFESN